MNDFETKDMHRAIRRHHVARLRAKRGKYFCGALLSKPRLLAMCINTPKFLTGLLHGNPRKHSGKKSFQERKSSQDAEFNLA